NPAAIISLFTDEEQQREAAGVFNTKLMELDTKSEREKAFHDILLSVKRNSLDHFSSQLGADVSAISKVIEGKKELEELSKTHISLD
ncbi:MAG: DNA primase, partial [Lachnospiraceae bacterium]|nr:DNA primase [Lachnospiraceae bacterium]